MSDRPPARIGYMSAEEVCRRYGFSLSTLRRAWYAGDFPQPIRVGRRSIRWRVSDLLAWEAAQEPYTPEPKYPTEEPAR